MIDTVTVDDVGKDVVDANGEQIGYVKQVDDGTALVDPRADVNAIVFQALGWVDTPGVYPLRSSAVEAVTESTIRLRSNL